MKKVYLIMGAILIISAVAFVFFQPAIKQEQSNKIKVAASFYPLYFFAKEIGQDKINVINITPPGAEPHEYDPTPRDVVYIQESKVLLLNGAGFESWADKIKQNINPENTAVIEVSDGLVKDEDHQEENETADEHGHSQDPHIWLNPLLAMQMAEKIAAVIISENQDNKDFYESNLNSLKKRLDDLNNAYKSGLQSCLQKNIVTSHAAFEYLADEYGLKQISIAGIVPEEEPSAQQLVELTKFVRDNNVKYIFFETLVNPELSNTLGAETGAKTLELNPIEGLTAEEEESGENYFTKMQENLNNLKIALQCQ